MEEEHVQLLDSRRRLGRDDQRVVGVLGRRAAVVAARMTTRYSRLAGWAIATVVVCWVLGMAIAVITESPLY